MNIFERRWAALTRREVTTATGKATQGTVGAGHATVRIRMTPPPLGNRHRMKKPPENQAEPCLRGGAAMTYRRSRYERAAPEMTKAAKNKPAVK